MTNRGSPRQGRPGAVSASLAVDLEASSPEPPKAWFLPARRGAAEAYALFAHGNAARIGDLPKYLEPLRAAGFGVLLIEYPGYGGSAGHPSRASIGAAFDAGYDWLAARRPGRPIALVGRSLGGAVACDLAARRPADVLVLISTFTDLAAMMRPYGVPPFLVRDRFDCRRSLSAHRGAVFIRHGVRDTTVPVAHGRALKSATPRARLKELPCRHNDCDIGPSGYWRDVLAAAQRHFTARARRLSALAGADGED